MFTSDPENVRIIEALAESLATLSIGKMRTYAELNRIAGRDVQLGRRDLLMRAEKKAEIRCGCIFSAVRGMGIKRLVADETPQVGTHAISGTRRKTKKAIDRMVRVNSNSMSGDARQNTALKLAHLNVLHGLADNRKTSTFVAPATADPYAAKKATKGGE